MGRVLLVLGAIFVCVALVAMTVSVISRTAEDSRSMARDASNALTRGDTMQKVGFVALILLMLGVTSGLLGGL